jgi:hypothetical protein
MELERTGRGGGHSYDMLGDESGRTWTRRSLTLTVCGIVIALLFTIILGIIALVFALLVRLHAHTDIPPMVEGKRCLLSPWVVVGGRRSLLTSIQARRSIILHGDVNGPSDSNLLLDVNTLANTSCPADLPVQTCAWVDGPGRCHNPGCLARLPNGTTTCETPIANSSTISGPICTPELNNITTAFNCTGGTTLCQVGVDAHGLTVLIQDGPTCLANTTDFDGDVTGLWNALTLVNSGAAPGCYGNATNSSITFPELCVDIKGRVTSITTQTFAFILTNGTFGLLSTPNQTTVTDLGGNVFQLGTIQNNDKEADLQFKRILLSPHTTSVVNTANSSYTLGLLGMSCFLHHGWVLYVYPPSTYPW